MSILLTYMRRALLDAAKWNGVDNMNQHCGDNVILFQQQVLSISDKAFLLTVPYSYSANWMSKIVIRNDKVSTFVCVV